MSRKQSSKPKRLHPNPIEVAKVVETLIADGKDKLSSRDYSIWDVDRTIRYRTDAARKYILERLFNEFIPMTPTDVLTFTLERDIAADLAFEVLYDNREVMKNQNHKSPG